MFENVNKRIFLLIVEIQFSGNQKFLFFIIVLFIEGENWCWGKLMENSCKNFLL
jgi:hypothetical protein